MYYKTQARSTTPLILAITAFLLVLSACSQEKRAKEAGVRKAPARSAPYKTIAPEYIRPEYSIYLPGELQPYEQVAVFAKVTGFVRELYADRGSYVRKGQLLALLEAPEMEQQYQAEKAAGQKAYSAYQYAQQSYDRLLDAAKTEGAVAPLELDRAKSHLESARSAHEASKAGTAATAQLKRYLRITAPFDGVITARNASPGALTGARSEQPLFTMAQNNRLRLILSLPEKHAASLPDSMNADFTVSTQPGRSFQARLSRTSTLLQHQDRALIMEFDVDNVSGDLQGNDYARVRLTLRRKNPTFWVPEGSLLRSQAGSFVLTIKNRVIKRIPVKEGLRLDTLSEVFGELGQQDQVILKASEEIPEGRIDG